MSVHIFNKLSRSPRAPSGRLEVSNVWHFDLRYIQLQPPSHVVVLLQPESSCIHTELVPIGQPRELGFAFFPDTAKEAAPEVAKALIHAFVTGLGAGKSGKNSCAPWAFTTDDQGLAKEVGVELKRLGVKAPQLCDVKYVPRLTQKADIAFDKVFGTLKAASGLKGIARAIMPAPQGISFSYFKLAPWVEQKSSVIDAALAYCQRLSGARPTSTDLDMGALMKEVETTMGMFERRHSVTVRTEADSGNPHAALEYSLRLQYGIQCTPSRSLCREYLIKVILNEKADNTMKSIAYSLLIEWYTQAFEGDTSANRCINAAAHSADEAVRLASGVSSPAVLFVAAHVLQKMAADQPQLYAQYKHIPELAQADNKATLKRMKQPNRYMCATVGCSVSADSGHMLMQCAGKCDQDKKPSYCSKECQRADWKNHKAFCTPGAPCSVLERPDTNTKGLSSKKGGTIEVPITNADGTTTFVSSSTVSAKTLKELKVSAEAAGVPSAFGGISLILEEMHIGGVYVEEESSDSEIE